jgi:hypothetical protein
VAVTVTNYGSAQNKTGSTTVVITTNALIPANTLLVLGYCADTGVNTAPTFSSATAVGGGTWTLAHQHTAAQTATAGSGVTVSAARLRTTSSVASGTAITLTFANSTVAKAAVLWGFTGILNTTRGNPGAGSGTATASCQTSGTALVAGDIVIALGGGENNAVPGGATDTLNGTWSTIDGLSTAGGSAVTNACIGMQFKVVTATGVQSYTTSSGGDAACIIFALQPEPEPTITQSAYRLYADGTESGSTALAAQDTAYTADLAADVNMQVRVRLQSTNATTVPATDDWQLQWEKNASGTWTAVTTATAEVLADSYDSVNASGSLAMADTPVCVAQSVMGNGRNLLGARFWMQKTAGSPTGPVTARLFDHTGTFGASGSVPSSSTPLATSTSKDASTMPASFDWVRFDFDGSVALSNGVPYFLGVEFTTGTSTNVVGVGSDTSSPTHPGLRAFRSSAGVWSSGAANDAIFEMYTSGPQTVVPYVSALLDNTAPSTNRLGAGTGSFTAGDVTEDGVANDQGWPGNNYTEHVYSVTLKSADLVNGDTLRFRVLRNSATTGMTYTQVPTVNITVGAGGLTASPADPVGITDAVTDLMTMDRQLGDPVGIADAVSTIQAQTTSVADNVGLTDSVVAGFAFDKVPSDPVGITDSVTVVQGLARTVPDNVGITDAQTIVQANVRSITDPVGATDLASGFTDFVRTFNDPVGIADVADKVLETGGVNYDKTPADPVGIADAIALDRSKSVSDPVGVTDLASNVQDLVRTVPDNIGITDNVVAQFGESQTLPDNVGITDSIALERGEPVTDAVGITDVAVAIQDLIEAVADAVGITDLASAALDRVAVATDPIGITDSVTVTSGAAQTVGDPVGITDSSSMLLDAVRLPADPTGITDLITKVQTLDRQQPDAVGITDQVTVVRSVLVSVGDSVGIADGTSYDFVGIGSASLSDDVGILDFVSPLQTSDRTRNESVGITDSVVAVRAFDRLIADNVGIVDSTPVVLGMNQTVADAIGIVDEQILEHSGDVGAELNVIVGGVKKTVTGIYVIVGGVKKAVTSVSVIVDGVKKT